MALSVSQQQPWHLSGPILLVGAGKMGSALLEGWLTAGLPPSRVLVQDPSPHAAAWCHTLGVRWRNTPGDMGVEEGAAAPAVIVLAVKPQLMADVLPAVTACAGPQTITLSIAAGKTMATFERHLPAGAAVVRAMPNTPASIGRGMTVLCANAAASAAQRALCARLMEAVGDVGWIADEALMDAVTAVSGSGPAYVFLMAEALAEAGMQAGLDPALAMQLARATIAGSGELLRRSPTIDPATLRANVTSPGGTTAAALAVLMADDGLAALMRRAVAAAAARGRELSK